MTSTEFANSKYKPLAMPMPFGANSDSNYVSPSSSSVNNAPNFPDGFPAAFSSPHSGGGQYITRQQMNGIGNLASRYEFYRRIGGLRTFDSAFATAVGGYPAGTVLDFLDGTNLHKVYSLVDNNLVDFTMSGVDGVNWALLNQDQGSARSYILSVDTVPSNSDSIIGTFKASRSGPLSVESTLVATDTSTVSVTWSHTSSSTAVYSFSWEGYGIMIADLGSGSEPTSIPPVISSTIENAANTGTFTSSWSSLLGNYGLDVAKSVSNNWTYHLGIKHSSSNMYVTKDHWYGVKLFNAAKRLTAYTFASSQDAPLTYMQFTLAGGFKLFYTA